MEPDKTPETPPNGAQDAPQASSAGGEASPPNNPKPAPTDDVSLAGDSPTETVPPVDVTNPEPQGMVPPPTTLTPVPKKKRGLKIGLIIAGVVLILSAGAAAAYYGIVVPNQPANILKKTLANTFSSDLKSVDMEGEYSVAAGESNEITGTFALAASSEGKFNFNTTVDAIVTNVTLDMRSVDGKTFYFKLGGLDGLPELIAQTDPQAAATYGALLKSINDQWYEINQSLIEQITGQSFDTTSLSAEDKQKLATAYKENQFLVVKEVLDDQKIKGVDCYHYRIVVDNEKLSGFFTAVKAADIKDLQITSEQLKTITDALKNANFDDHPVDVWIDKDTKLFKQFVFSMKENDDTFWSLRATVVSYNQPVEVEKPTDAKSVLEILTTLYGGTDSASLLFEDALNEGADTNGVSL